MGKFVVKPTAKGIKFDLKAGNGEVIDFPDADLARVQAKDHVVLIKTGQRDETVRIRDSVFLQNRGIRAVGAVDRRVLQHLCQDLAARHLYDITASAMMAHLLVLDASRSPELFGRSVRVYLNLAEAEVAKNEKYIANLCSAESAILTAAYKPEA